MSTTAEPTPKRARPKLATVGKRELGASAAASADVAARWAALDTLRPWADNPRLNDGEPVRRVADSVKRFGWGAPVLARGDGEIVAGHTRVKAAELLIAEYGSSSERDRKDWHSDALRVATLREVPVRVGEWSEREAHLLALADNRLGELADWNVPQLQELLAEFALPEVEIAGWRQADLDAMAESLISASEVGSIEAEGRLDRKAPKKCEHCSEPLVCKSCDEPA